jgi:hypothetical protein
MSERNGVLVCGLDSSCSEQVPMVGSFEHDNALSGSIKDKYFLAILATLASHRLLLYLCLPPASCWCLALLTLKMEATCSSEMSVNFHWATARTHRLKYVSLITQLRSLLLMLRFMYV